MIVDDEVFNQIGLKMMMKTLDRFPSIVQLVDTADDGKISVEMAKKGLEKNYTYALILMDLSMPVMDGFEATELLRELYEGHQ